MTVMLFEGVNVKDDSYQDAWKMTAATLAVGCSGNLYNLKYLNNLDLTKLRYTNAAGEFSFIIPCSFIIV